MQLGTRFCALVDCNHQAMTAPFEYRGSLACIFIAQFGITKVNLKLTECVEFLRSSNSLPDVDYLSSLSSAAYVRKQFR